MAPHAFCGALDRRPELPVLPSRKIAKRDAEQCMPVTRAAPGAKVRASLLALLKAGMLLWSTKRLSCGDFGPCLRLISDTNQDMNWRLLSVLRDGGSSAASGMHAYQVKA